MYEPKTRPSAGFFLFRVLNEQSYRLRNRQLGAEFIRFAVDFIRYGLTRKYLSEMLIHRASFDDPAEP